MKKIILSLSVFLIVMVGFMFSISMSTFDLYADQPSVKYDEVLDGNVPTIYYYYQDTCHYCNSIKPQITAFTNIINTKSNIDLKLIDMKDDYNKAAWSTTDQQTVQDPKQIKTAQDIEVIGTPQMIFVKDHEVKQIAAGSDVFDILEYVANMYNIDYTFDRSKYGKS